MPCGTSEMHTLEPVGDLAGARAERAAPVLRALLEEVAVLRRPAPHAMYVGSLVIDFFPIIVLQFSRLFMLRCGAQVKKSGRAAAFSVYVESLNESLFNQNDWTSNLINLRYIYSFMSN